MMHKNRVKLYSRKGKTTGGMAIDRQASWRSWKLSWTLKDKRDLEKGTFEGKINVASWKGVEEAALTAGVVLEWSGNLDWMSTFYQIMKGFGSWKAGRLDWSLHTCQCPNSVGDPKVPTCMSQLPLREPTGKRGTLQNQLKPKGLITKANKRRNIVTMANVRNGSQFND